MFHSTIDETPSSARASASSHLRIKPILIPALLTLFISLALLFRPNLSLFRPSFPLHLPKLTRETEGYDTLLKHSFEVHGETISRRVVIITAATHQYTRFVRNLQCSVHAATNQQPVLFALDAKMLARARELQLPAVRFLYELGEKTTQEKPHTFGSEGFNAITKLKLVAVREALMTGIDVLFTDVDVVWCDDAAADIVRRIEKDDWADVIIQNGWGKDGKWPVEPNTGFFYAKATSGVIELFSHLIRISDRGDNRKLCDQWLFKKAVCGTEDGGKAYRKKEVGRVGNVCKWRDRVNVEMLPLKTYPNGKNPIGIKFDELPDGALRRACVNKDIVIFHNNWSAARHKPKRMDQHGLWAFNTKNGTCTEFH